MKVLITGGAGFIGTHLCRRLLATTRADVTVLDNFSVQVHSKGSELPPDLIDRVELIRGSITDADVVAKSLRGQDVIVHLAAETGTGQSMYQIKHYEGVNIGGTCLLLDHLINSRQELNIKKIVVASSRAIYGEGKYTCTDHGVVYPSGRNVERLREGTFDPTCPICSKTCEPLATDENTPVNPSSFYGLSKLVQEQTVLMFARELGISAFALRYQNVFGPGQSLSNPYTGLLAVFVNLIRAGRQLNIFEDGLESRDFVYVDDVVDATCRAITAETLEVASVNIGSGQPTTVLDVANALSDLLDVKLDLNISGVFRAGDIRHNYADLSRAKALLGYQPKWKFRDGLRQFVEWALTQENPESLFDHSLQELKARGLLHD